MSVKAPPAPPATGGGGGDAPARPGSRGHKNSAAGSDSKLYRSKKDETKYGGLSDQINGGKGAVVPGPRLSYGPTVTYDSPSHKQSDFMKYSREHDQVAYASNQESWKSASLGQRRVKSYCTFGSRKGVVTNIR